MFEELTTADKCVCCKKAGLVTTPHALMKQWSGKLVEVLRCVGRGLCMLKTSDLGNNAGLCVLDINVEEHADELGAFCVGYIVIVILIYLFYIC